LTPPAVAASRGKRRQWEARRAHSFIRYKTVARLELVTLAVSLPPISTCLGLLRVSMTIFVQAQGAASEVLVDDPDLDVCGQPGQHRRCWLRASLGPLLLLRRQHARQNLQAQKALPSDAAALLGSAAYGRLEAQHPAIHSQAALCWHAAATSGLCAGRGWDRYTQAHHGGGGGGGEAKLAGCKSLCSERPALSSIGVHKRVRICVRSGCAAQVAPTDTARALAGAECETPLTSPCGSSVQPAVNCDEFDAKRRSFSYLVTVRT